jgi:hypothetical protein
MFLVQRLLLLRCILLDLLQPLHQYRVHHQLRPLRGRHPLQLRLRIDLDLLLLLPLLLRTKLLPQPLDLLLRLLDPHLPLSHVYLDHLSIDNQ